MAGYAAALRVLTGYRWIGADDMAQEALRPRRKGEVTTVDKLIEMAVGIATEYLVPEGLPRQAWERRVPEERCYLKKIGRETCRESVLQDVYITGVHREIKTKHKISEDHHSATRNKITI